MTTSLLVCGTEPHSVPWFDPFSQIFGRVFFYILDTLLWMLLQNLCLYNKVGLTEKPLILHHAHIPKDTRKQVYFVKISILTWLPSRCQKTVG